MSITDEFWMNLAIHLAKAAARIDEVPVGAVLVKGNQPIAVGVNLRESHQDPTAHAEMIAIQKASQALKSWRLLGCTLYVTLEPCIMCSGALIQSRVERVVYSCKDPKGGGMGSLYSIHHNPLLNHTVQVDTGLRENESSRLLKDFFRHKRKAKKIQKQSTTP